MNCDFRPWLRKPSVRSTALVCLIPLLFSAAACNTKLSASNDDESEYRAFATRIEQGADITQHAWGWIHEGNKRPIRMYAGISRALLKDLPTLSGAARESALRFMCDSGIGKPLNECTAATIEAYIAELERELSASEAQ